jgi:kynurenine formamidase
LSPPVQVIEGSSGGAPFRADLARAVDISIPLDFGGPQPSFFGAPRASAEPLVSGDYTGDTRRGGSCNAEAYRLVPHCNGTHTECVGHLTDERLAIRDLTATLIVCRLITVQPRNTRDGLQIDEDALGGALGTAGAAGGTGLVIRTLPNDAGKRGRAYASGSMPASFTPDAMSLLVDLGVEHLLVDLPSVDPGYDGGRLAAHRVFWGLPPGSRRAAAASRGQATITEMIYVPDEVLDGSYLLNLQIPPFMSDAAPSRPLLFPLVWLGSVP